MRLTLKEVQSQVDQHFAYAGILRPPIVHVEYNEIWGAEYFPSHEITFKFSESMTLDEVKYLILHECYHGITKEMGHNVRLYDPLVCRAKELGIPYSVVLKMEDGEWWSAALRY